MPRFRLPCPLTPDEEVAIDRLARSRIAPARAVDRNRIVANGGDGTGWSRSPGRWGICADTVRRRVKRFGAAGPAGLADAGRASPPDIHPRGDR